MKRIFRIVERNILFETSDEEAHKYASTQAVLPQDIVDLVKKTRSAIDQEDLHADGFGPEPHITVLYGLGDEDKDTALEVMRGAGQVKAKVSGVDVFNNDDYDVVIFTVESDDLSRLRDKLDQVIPDNMNSWPDYKPHMTIAYVLPGKGEAYKDMESELVGREFDLDGLEFSGTDDDDVERVELRGVPVPDDTHEIEEESPLFGTDILAGEETGTEDAVKKALHPILNRSNRRIVSVREDDSGVNVLLDNGQNLVLNRGPDNGPKESWLITHNDKQFDTADLASLESLVKRLSSPTIEAEGDDPGADFGWKRYDEPPEAPADVDAPPEKLKPARKKRSAGPQVPQSKIVTVHNDGYKIVVTPQQPTGYRGSRRFDRVDEVLSILNASPMVRDVAIISRTGAGALTVDIHDKSAEQFNIVNNAIRYALENMKFEVRNQARMEKPSGLLRRAARMIPVAGRFVDDMQEDTFSSDVGFTDTIPITKARRRKVNLPGLTKTRGRRRTKRKYDVKESMSKGTSPILLVLRPQQVDALSDKPVWSALHESGVISTKSFDMGEETFFEVSIDTLRKEWTEANAGVLLDEIGAIDPRLQRKVMERVDTNTLADYIVKTHPSWCESIPVDVALTESETVAEGHRQLRLNGQTPEGELMETLVSGDPGIALRMLEWYDLSREVIERLAAIDKGAVTHAAKHMLKEEGTDPSAGVGGNTGGMPTANTAGATIQGYSEEDPEGVSVGSHNWPAQGMFKIHVLVGEAPQWVYRQVVGHEGEGDQSMIVYRTPEGRVMRMPHEQIDAAAGFGAVVTPEELSGSEAGEGDDQPMPDFQQSPEPQPVEPVPAGAGEPFGEQTDPNQDKLTRDATFSKALAKYQQSKDERDWDEVRTNAERVTGLKGPELDASLAPLSGVGNEERQPMYGGAREEFVSPHTGKMIEYDQADEAAGSELELTNFNSQCRKCNKKLDADDFASGKCKKCFTKIEPELVDAKTEGGRQAEAVRMFSKDDKFHELMNKFEVTRNEGYLIRATERASRVAGIPLNEARSLIDEILEAVKKTV